MKATDQYFPVVLFIIYAVLGGKVLNFEAADEILKCGHDHSNESY